jgi:hypothetical protein
VAKLKILGLLILQLAGALPKLKSVQHMAQIAPQSGIAFLNLKLLRIASLQSLFNYQSLLPKL